MTKDEEGVGRPEPIRKTKSSLAHLLTGRELLELIWEGNPPVWDDK